MTKTKVSTFQRKTDHLLQVIYQQLYPTCLVCGGRTTEMHHYIPKSQSAYLRYKEYNLVSLCRGCHSRHHLAGDPSIIQTIIKKKGQAWVERLDNERRILQKTGVGYYRQIIEELLSEAEKREICIL